MPCGGEAPLRALRFLFSGLGAILNYHAQSSVSRSEGEAGFLIWSFRLAGVCLSLGVWKPRVNGPEAE